MNENPISEEDLLSAQEASELLPGTSTQAILRWARTGKIPTVKLPSGRRFFRRSDVEAILQPSFETPESAQSPETGELF